LSWWSSKLAYIGGLLGAYLVALLGHLLLAWYAKEQPQFLVEDKIISLWTADGGLHGFYAKEILAGHSIPFNSTTALGHLLAFLADKLHLDLDRVLFYAPGFLGSLIALPLVGIFWVWRKFWLGVAVGAIAGIAVNYYFRTHLGYCDTDMLIFPLFYLLLFSWIATLNRGLLWSLVGIGAIQLLLASYHSARPIVYGSLLFLTLYLFLLERKNPRAYFLALILYGAALPLPFPWSLLLALGLLGLGLWLERRSIDHRILMAIFLLGALGIGDYGWTKGYFKRIGDYLYKESHLSWSDKRGQEVQLEATLKTVFEARGISWEQLTLYGAGGTLPFLLGSIGLLLLARRERGGALLLFPYLIALLALKGGVRLTTFGVPAIVAGNLYLFYLLSHRFATKRWGIALFALPSLILFGYYLRLVDQYNRLLSPFFTRDQLQVIQKSLNDSKKGYILTWWDYGWPLWYYTNKRTLIDNGKHQWDNFVVARSLLSSDLAFVARFDRFAIEWFDRIYPWAVFPYLLKRYSYQELMAKLQRGELQMKKRNEIYYYFDDRILLRLPIIQRFAYLKGEKPEGFIWTDRVVAIDSQAKRITGRFVQIDLGKGLVSIQGKEYPFGYLILHDGTAWKAIGYRKLPYTIILYKKRYLIGTSGYLKSFFFRTFFFNDPGPYFTTLAYTKEAKVFKLK